MVRNRPIVLDDGDYLLPVYHETGHDTGAVGPDSTSLFLRCDVKQKRWTRQAPRPVSVADRIMTIAVAFLNDDHATYFDGVDLFFLRGVGLCK